jgi:transcriptional regulator with XRE-family HTH domain
MEATIEKSLAATSKAVDFAAMLTGSQIRAARALLKWSGRELSERCGVSYPALQRAEAVDGMPNMQTRNLAAIKSALEAGGVMFIDGPYSGDGGAGVRLK